MLKDIAIQFLPLESCQFATLPLYFPQNNNNPLIIEGGGKMSNI